MASEWDQFPEVNAPAAPDWQRQLNFNTLEQQHGLPAGLLNAVMQQESAGDPRAVSPKGARGLFQFMPETATEYGIDPLVPEQAAAGAARMYGDLSRRYGGDLPQMLAGYNWGQGNLARQGMARAPAETRDYISKIMSRLPTASSGRIMQDTAPEASWDEFPLVQAPAAVEDPWAAFPEVQPQTPPAAATPSVAPAQAPRSGFQTYVSDPFGRGIETLQQSYDIGKVMLGIDQQKAMEDFIRNEAEKQQYPVSPEVQAGTKEILASKGFVDTVKSLAKNPKAVLNTVVESLAASLPSLAGGAAGTVGGGVAGAAVGGPVGATAGGVAGGMAGAGVGSFATEFTNSVADQLAQSGVNMQDPLAMMNKINEPAFRKNIIEKASNRAAAVAAFDAISMGLAGRVAKPVAKLVGGGAIRKGVAGGGAEIATQAGAGAGGEAAAQVASEGKITSPGAIGLEAVGEIVPGGIEAATNILAAKVRPQNQPPQPPIPPSAQPKAETAAPPVYERPQAPVAPSQMAPIASPVEPGPTTAGAIPAPISIPAAEPPAPPTVAPTITPPVWSYDVGQDGKGQFVISRKADGKREYFTEFPTGGWGWDDGTYKGTPVTFFTKEQAQEQINEEQTKTSAQPAAATPPQASQNIPETGISPGALPTSPKGLPTGSVKAGDQVVWNGETYTVEEISSDGVAARLKTGNPRMVLDVPLTELSGTTPTAAPAASTPEPLPAGASNYETYDAARKYAKRPPSAPGTAAPATLFGAKQKKVREKAGFTPIINYLAGLGGFDQKSNTAKNLGALGITPETHTRLFRVGSKQGLDNIPVSEFNNQFSAIGLTAQDDGTGHVDQNWLLDQLRQEAHGQGLASPEQQAKIDKQNQIDEVLNILGKEGHDITTMTNAEVQAVMDEYLKTIEKPETTLSPEGEEIPFMEAPAEAAAFESTRQKRKAYAPGTPEEVAKTGGAGFEQFATNTNININKKVFEDMGLNPDEAVQLAPIKQRQIIVDAFMDKFKMKVVFDQKLNIKDQIDQLADMYVGLNNMAFSLGLPARAMSLNGTVGLEIAGKRPYLGVYDPNINQITIPNKSNSFAHEWLHALDHMLIKEHGVTSKRLFSGHIRKEGFDAQNPLQQAFLRLLNSIFFDDAKLAATVIELEDAAANGKTETIRDEAQKSLDEIAAGNYRGVKIKNEYFAAAKEVPGSRAYWTMPEEMMARAVEAYIGWKLDNAGVSTRGVSKKNVAYATNADIRLAKAFPKLEDRNHIFDALDDFFARLGESQIMGESTNNLELMQDPHFLGVLDPRFWEKSDRTKRYEDMGWLRSTLNQTWDQFKQDTQDAKIRSANAKQLKDQQKAIENIISPKTGGWWNRVSIRDIPLVSFWNHMWRTERTDAHSLEKKYPAIKAVRELLDRVFSRPGEGTAVSAVYSQRLATSVNQASKVMERIMKKHFKNLLSLPEKDQLRNAFLGQEVMAPKGSKHTKDDIVKAAADLRLMADTTWKRMREAGFEVGYVANGAWLRRHYIVSRVMAYPDRFLKAAMRTYRDQFNEVFGSPEAAVAKLEDFLDVVQGMLRADPDGLTFDKKILEQIKAAIDAKDNAKVLELISGIYNEIGDKYSQLAAQKWLGELVSGGSKPQFESVFPVPGFMKKRGLPPSADTHLKEFMETDVEKILFQYMTAANTAIAHKSVFNPKGAPSMKKLLEEARGQGMSEEDASDMEDIINRVVQGPDISARTRKIGKVITLMRTGAILMQLNKVIYSALAEPWVVGFKTRNVLNGFRAYADAVADLIGTKEAKYFREVADIIGAIGTDYADMMQSERLGGGLEMGLLSRETMAKFFRFTGNTGITNVQSRAAIRAGYRWMHYLSNKLINGSENEKSMARRDLAELGIGGDKVEAFSRWLIDNEGHPDLRTLNESDAVFTGVFTDAVVRFRDQAVQHPKKEDRPALANHPVGSVIYTGLGFTFSFWDNVVKAEAQKVANIAKNEGAGAAAWAVSNHLMTIGAMLTTAYLVNTLRLMQYDKDKYDELKEKDPEKLEKLLWGRALENTSILGAAYGVLFNIFKGVEYGRDLATSASGLVLSSYLNWAQKMIELATRNSPNTTTQEHAAIKETYRVLAAPLITGVMLNTPGPKSLLAVPIGVASMYINSNVTADTIADLAGFPKGKTEGAGSKPGKTNLFGQATPKKSKKTDLLGNPIKKKSERTNLFGQPIGKK